METFFLFIFLVIILILVIGLRNLMNSNLTRMEKKIDDLNFQLKKIQQQQPEKTPWRKEEEEKLPHRSAPSPVIEKPAEKKPVQTKPVEPKSVEEKPILTTAPSEHRPVNKPESEPVKTFEQILAESRGPKTAEPVPKAKEAKPGFFERNPDLEKFIGENLANKIGIAILVLGIGFFVKYAIDQNWIDKIGRVFIGILCGGILLGIAHRLRKTFVGFSSVLVGGGMAVLYFTITIAFREYGIFSPTVAFLIMVLITGFTILLSLAYNRVELAVFAVLGGFGSPFMVASGKGEYVVLFTYLLILNSGMLVLAYYKKWRIVNIICYVFTIIIYGGWLSAKFDTNDSAMIGGALLFATLFYFIFFAMNIVSNIRLKIKFEAMEILMLLSNTFLYYSAGMRILQGEAVDQFQGLFTAALGAFNFIFAYSLYKNQNVDRNLVFMLIGLVLTFISLAAPIQLEGNYITLFWAAEAVLLLWLGQKSGIQLIKIASVMVNFLMIISLVMDMKQIYFDQDLEMNILLNKGYITSIVAIGSFILTLKLLKTEKDTPTLKVKEYKTAVVFLLCLFVYTAHFLELIHHLVANIDSYSARTVIVGTYNMFFVLLLLLTEKRIQLPEGLKILFPAWSVIVIGAYILYYHNYIIDTRDAWLNGITGISGFAFHYLLLALAVTNVIICLRRLNRQTEFIDSIGNGHWWLFIMFFVFAASAELDHTVLLIGFTDPSSADHLITQNHKIGFAILWGLTSFLLIAVGLKRKIKTLRIISLTLLLVTLLKLFIFDLRGISEGGKIAAFISLGVLLLIVSFMYQRLKKILLDDAPAEQTEHVK